MAVSVVSFSFSVAAQSEPLRPGVAFPTTTRLQLALELNCPLFNSSALYYLQTPTGWYGHASTPPQFLPMSGDRDVSLPLSLEWPVWSSSSRNNCHAVQRSLSSGASVYGSIMGFFFTSSHFISQFPPTRFPLITAIRMFHFLPVCHPEWHFWPGQKVKTLQFADNLMVYALLFFVSSLLKSRKWLNSSIWTIDGTLTGTTSLGQSEPRGNAHEEVLLNPQSSRTGALLSDAV